MADALRYERGLIVPDADDAGERGREALLLDGLQIFNIIKSMGDSLMVLSPDAEVWFANKATESMLGYSLRELSGMPLAGLVEDTNLIFFSALREMITEGPIRNWAVNYIVKGGRRVPVSLNGSVLRERGGGRLLGMALVARDMRDVLGLVKELEDAKTGLEEKVRERTGELERAYSELKDAHAQLLQREKMASIGQLAAGVAHEINNPVGFLLSNLGTLETYMHDLLGLINVYESACGSLKEKKEVPPSAFGAVEEFKKKLDSDFLLRDAVEVIKESKEGAERVRRIVADLKEFSHVDSAELAHADLNAALDSTLNIANNELRHRARVVRQYGALPKVKCNIGELNQVFMNLVINACHSIKDFGTVTVRTRHGSGSVFIEISDTGCGIPPENLRKIFDPFFTTKPVGVGTGLGLTIAYKIIKRHRGDITVESSPGEGTTFMIKLPVDPDAPGMEGNAGKEGRQ